MENPPWLTFWVFPCRRFPVKYQTNEQTDLAQKLWKFVAQIHRVHHALLGIPEICQPRSVHNLPMWVDLLVPHENDSPKAKAEREACVVSPDVWKVMNETAAKARHPRMLQTRL
ncbi:hypothetical protein PG987_009389 [Apiospora arundinis]